MALFKDLLDQSKQLNRAPNNLQQTLPFHAQKKHYKIIHQALIIPDLPAPFHYLNCVNIIGQPDTSVFLNQSQIHTYPLDTAIVSTSISAKMLGHLKSYSIKDECLFTETDYLFLDNQKIFANYPNFTFERNDSELSYKLEVSATNLASYFFKLRMGLGEHWSVLCQCVGEISYKNEKAYINQIGSLEFTRFVNTPYLPFAFYSYQLVNLKNRQQLLFVQVRDEVNSIIQTRVYFRDLDNSYLEIMEDKTEFNIYRVFPKIKTPNKQDMYLPREFGWKCEMKDGTKIELIAKSRGDYKFGLGAGFVGSFEYSLKVGEYEENGESGYCEYIDCRKLKYQEQNSKEENKALNADFVPYLVKK